MLVSRRIRTRLALTFALLLSGALCAAATAAPITVQLRVEGATATLFEGNIATEGESFQTTSSGGAHPCNYSENGNSGGFTNGGNAGGTPTSALHDAALAAGLPFDAEWFSSSGDFFVSRVGADANQSAPPFDSWGFAVNNTTAPVGGCQVALAPGNEVLWAYNYFNLKHLLGISGPATAGAGVPFTVHVSDAQNGSPIPGAAIGEVVEGITTTLPASTTTDANGNATVTLSTPGTVRLKATQAESVRSNAISLCVHNGFDGTCGTNVPKSLPGLGGPLPGPPAATTVIARVAGVVNGHIYRHGSAPRILRGAVVVPAGGTLRDVRISLQRRRHGHCFIFSGLRGAFVRSHCGSEAFFSVGGSQSFSFLLPARLPAGRYTYDVEALESSGRATKPLGGLSHVVFRVR